jgi:hypothetical protein
MDLRVLLPVLQTDRARLRWYMEVNQLCAPASVARRKCCLQPLDVRLLRAARNVPDCSGSFMCFAPCIVLWLYNINQQNAPFLNHHHHLSVTQLGHLLTRSGLTYPEVSSKVCHDSFCQLENSVSLPWVIYCEAFYLHVVSSFFCIPVICPECRSTG